MSSRRSTVSKQIQKQAQVQLKQPIQLKQTINAKEEVMEMSSEPIQKRPWEKIDAEGNVIKRKKVPGAKNIRIRKHVQPRNAVACLHELVPATVYTTVQEGGVGQQFGVNVTVEGKKFHGLGQSLKIAKQNAAEAALVSFVKPPVPKEGTGEENEIEDKTPWATLAAFAMYKLFNDWDNGRIGSGNQEPQIPIEFTQNMQCYVKQMAGIQLNSASRSAIAKHLGTPTANTKSPEPAKGINTHGIIKPAKQIPDNAASMHPVMVLHQMRPDVKYISNKTTGDDSKPYFYVSADIDGNQFTGEGSNIKKAKFHLARDAIYALFGVESCFELPI